MTIMVNVVDMESEQRFQQALQVAHVAHKGQARYNGEPYVYHSIRVAGALSSLSERIVGVLHDVLEEKPLARLVPKSDDIKFWVLDLGSALTGSDCFVWLHDYEAEALAALTRSKGIQSYSDYIETIKSVGGLAVIVKLADLADNLKDLPPAKESLRKRYEKARSTLFPLVCNE